MNRNRSLAKSATFLCLSLAACSGDAGTGPLAAPSLSTFAQEPAVERPWRGKCDVAAAFISETTLRFTGPCQLAHIGRATVVAYQTIDPGPSGIAYTNTATYTAANGEELRTTGAGIATPTSEGLELSGIETATGGTGRFENASGTAALSGAVRFTSQTTTVGAYTLEGRLIY